MKTASKQWSFTIAAGTERLYQVSGKVSDDAEGEITSQSSLSVPGLVDVDLTNNQQLVKTTVVPAELVALGAAQSVSEGQAPDLAFLGSDEAEVVFERVSDGVTRIYSQLLSAQTAAPIGDEVLISEGEGINPAIAVDPSSSMGTIAGGARLRVWQKNDVDPNRIRGLYTTRTSSTALLLAKGTTAQRRPAVTSRPQGLGGGFLAVWESVRDPDLAESPGSDANRSGIFGRFVDPLGQLQSPLPRLNLAAKPDPMRPDLAAFGNGFLVVWDTPRTPGSTKRRIVGQWLNAEGRPRLREFFISGPGRDSQDPTIAFSRESRRFVVVWQEIGHREAGLGFRTIGVDGSLGPETFFGMKDLDRDPDVTSQTEHFTVVFDRRILGTLERPYSQLITVDGDLDGDPVEVNALRQLRQDPDGKVDVDEVSSHPSVAFLPGSDVEEGRQVFFVVWSEPLEEGREIRTQRYAVAADLVVSVTDQPDPIPETGGTLVYTVTVENLGPSEARRVELRHVLPPEGVTPLFLSGCTAPEPLSTCGLGTMEVGQTRQYTLEVDVAPVAGVGPLEFLATAESLTPDPYLPDNTGRQLTALGDADLGLTLAPASSSAVAGQRFTWEVTVSNAGPSAAGGVVVEAPLPSNVTLAADSDCEPGPEEASAQDLASCTVGELARGEERRLELAVELAPTLRGRLSQSVRVEALTGDSDTRGQHGERRGGGEGAGPGGSARGARLRGRRRAALLHRDGREQRLPGGARRRAACAGAAGRPDPGDGVGLRR